MIDTTFERFRYHKPLPNFYKIENPQDYKSEISDELLAELNELAKKYDFTGISYSKLSDDFKKEFTIDFDNVLIFKFLMGDVLIEMDRSFEKCKMKTMSFRNMEYTSMNLQTF